jgi:hypothetical protein
MATRYTDVDLMILERWGEVQALREAFDVLADRIRETVQTCMAEVGEIALAKGLESEVNRKKPSLFLWKREWQNRNRDTGLYFEIADVVPAGCAKSGASHPSITLLMEDFEKLRVRESREDFGRTLRSTMSPQWLANWSGQGASLSEYPIVRDYVEVSEADRVAMVGEHSRLKTFLSKAIDDVLEILPAIDDALGKMTRR